VYAEAPVTVRVEADPAQVVPVPEIIIVGVGFTVMRIVFVDVHPSAFVPLTEYAVLDKGDTAIAELLAPPGCQVYVKELPAVNVAVLVEHIDGVLALTDTTGFNGLLKTVNVAVDVPPVQLLIKQL
jgi:hypothetical protein